MLIDNNIECQRIIHNIISTFNYLVKVYGFLPFLVDSKDINLAILIENRFDLLLFFNYKFNMTGPTNNLQTTNTWKANFQIRHFYFQLLNFVLINKFLQFINMLKSYPLLKI